MRVLSLFSGGGLGDYGLEKAGIEIVGQVEIDEYCQKILALRWPDVPKWCDVRWVTGEEVGRLCGRIDLVSGGFPCQDISTAGKGAGISGERSGLWKEMFRIICEIRPRYVLVENVSALLSRGLGTVLGDLASIGYDCEWDCIPASALGAPHQRDRVWIVAYSRSGGFGQSDLGAEQSDGTETLRAGAALSFGETTDEQGGSARGSSPVADTPSNGMERRSAKPRKPSEGKALRRVVGCGEDVSDAESERRQRRDRRKGNRPQSEKGIFGRLDSDGRSDWWAVEPSVGRVAHGITKRVDRLKLLGNGQVVQVVEYIGRQIIEFDKQGK